MENRWLQRLRGILPKDTAAGEYDLHVLLAIRFKWTPEQVNAPDPHFLEELLAFQGAEGRYEEEQRKEAERKRRQAEAGRGRR